MRARLPLVATLAFLPHAITATITSDTIRCNSQCVGGVWTYRFEGQGIALTPVMVPTCDRGRILEEAAIETAFDAITHVRRTAKNAVEFSGGGRSIMLFSQ